MRSSPSSSRTARRSLRTEMAGAATRYPATLAVRSSY